MGDARSEGGIEPLLDQLTTLVSRAAAAILAARASGLNPLSKADRSPVTAADMVAESVIMAGLAALAPGVPVVSEESVEANPPGRLDGDFILVDPLDGTRELVAGRDEFTVNVAVLRAGRPALGIIAAPAYGLLWRGRVGAGAERLRLAPGAPAADARERVTIRTRPRPATELIAAVSRSHPDAATEALLGRLPVTARLICGSSIKFCRLAEGVADFYPRLSTTCEWDVAAGHALLAAAGGAVTRPDGTPLAYGRTADRFLIPAFIAVGDPSAASLFQAGRQA
jgi:3'(2'), 5'-bisphosphate nucleotidase